MIYKTSRTQQLLVAVLMTMTVSLAGCAPEVPEPTIADGPWASAFATNYSMAEDDFTRSVLEDGEITEQEFSETLDKFRTCLSARDISISTYEFDGSFDITFPPGSDSGVANEAAQDCSRSSGEYLIGALYTWVHRNPENINEDELIAECMVAAGIVPDGYSTEDYAQDIVDDDFGFVDETADREKLATCRMDPLGLSQK